MFDYLQKFNNLPQDLRNQISSPPVMAALSELENKYRVYLAMIVMKMMIKELAVKNLPAYLASEFDLSPLAADELTRELQAKVLTPVAGYLGFIAGKSVISAKSLNKIATVVDKPKDIISKPLPPVNIPMPEIPLMAKISPAPAPDSQAKKQRALDIDKDIDLLIKEAGLVLPSEAYVGRLKNILVTYLRGIRNKIDTRNALTKDVEIGGLHLSTPEADRIFKVCDSRGCRLPENGGALTSHPAATRLDKIIATAEKAPSTGGASAEYNLKKSLADNQVKVSAALDSKHELAMPEKQLNLPRPIQTSTPTPKSTPKPTPTPTPTPKPTPAPTPTVKNIPFVSRPAPVSSPSRPQMHDIKPMPKVMGPIEELQFLDLINFRRLGSPPAEITAKIFAKIKLLEKDGYDKMVAGVHAWRLSPVNRLYIGLGQEAIAKGISVKEAVALRQKTDPGSLNMGEIEEIVKLNSRLAF